jgi:hypothetical protein
LKISLQATMILAGVFAVICLGVAISGFTALGDIADPTEASDAMGFAWFWAFLASMAAALGLLAWWMARAQSESDDA